MLEIAWFLWEKISDVHKGIVCHDNLIGGMWMKGSFS